MDDESCLTAGSPQDGCSHANEKVDILPSSAQSKPAISKLCSVGQSQGFHQMYVNIDNIILYYTWK